MSSEAKVVSIEILETFRNRLVIYVEDAKRALDEVGDAVRKTREWLNTEQTRNCQIEMKRCARRLEEAEAELYSARLQDLNQQHAAKKVQVTRARRKMDEAEQKAKKVKRWCREYDHLVEPLEKKLEGLRQVLAHDLPKGVMSIREMQKSLERYAEVNLGSPAGTMPAAPSKTDEESTGDEGGEES